MNVSIATCAGLVFLFRGVADSGPCLDPTGIKEKPILSAIERPDNNRSSPAMDSCYHFQQNDVGALKAIFTQDDHCDGETPR